jgi:hypothetical protein
LALSLNNLITGKEISPHWEGRCVAGEITLNRYTKTNQAGENGIELWICGYYNHCNEEEQRESFPQMGEFLRTGLRPTEKNNSNEDNRKKAETQHKRKCHLVLCDGNGHWDQSDIDHLTPIIGQSTYKYFFRSCMENLPHLTNISMELTPENNPENIFDRASNVSINGNTFSRIDYAFAHGCQANARFMSILDTIQKGRIILPNAHNPLIGQSQK